MRKIFTVWIRNNEYDVYSIEGKEHAGHGDIPKTWWIYLSQRVPEGCEPPIDSEHFHPYHKWIKRRLWEVKIKETNSVRYKWDDTNFSHNCNVEMWCNNKLVYVFNTNDLEFALSKIGYLKVILEEHAFNFFEQEKENGRKIFYYGLPAYIRVTEPGSICIYPDYVNGLTKDTWWKHYENRRTVIQNESSLDFCDKQFLEMDKDNIEEDRQNEYVNWGSALADQNINWFRK